MVLRVLSLCALVAFAHAADRRLSLQRIVGYEPKTQVTDHAAIDLDQKSMEQELFLERLIKARNVYIQGGHSRSYAELKLINPAGPRSYKANTDVLGKALNGAEIVGRLMHDVSWKNGTKQVKLDVQYATSDIQESYVGCQVGGLYTFSEANRDGCKSPRAKCRTLYTEGAH
jgi:hypothetical protein